MTRDVVMLRLLPLAIAVAGVVDPAVTLTGATRPRLAVVEQDPTSRVSAQVRTELARDLGTAYEIVPQVTSDAEAAIVIGDRYPLTDVALAKSVSRKIATVTLSAPNVRLVHVNAPREVPAATAIHLEVDVDAHDVAGQTADLTARIAGLEVGHASHRWTQRRERWRAVLDLVPIGDAPFIVHLEAGAAAADAVVLLRTRPLRVQVYDPRPSWASTFVRRVLEADPRFAVESVTFSSRGVAARTGGAVPLNDSRLDSFDAVVVGGLDRLAAVDVRSLDRYMRERSGSVVLLPDQRIGAGPVRDLVSGSVRFEPSLTERLLERAATLGAPRRTATLRASELLIWRALPPGGEVFAYTPADERAPVVVSVPRGAGRLFVSGAMDAWRFRAADEAAFDRFWQAAIAGLALATPPPLDVAVFPPALRPVEPADVVVHVRGREAATARVGATVDGDQPIRLWPDVEAGVYRGRFTPRTTPGRLAIEAVAIGGAEQSASRVVPVRADVRHASDAVIPPLSMLAATHGGIDVTPDRVADVARFTRGSVQLPRAPLARRPMRSAWWIVPFAGSLSAEWWIRRRRGLR